MSLVGILFIVLRVVLPIRRALVFPFCLIHLLTFSFLLFFTRSNEGFINLRNFNHIAGFEFCVACCACVFLWSEREVRCTGEYYIREKGCEEWVKYGGKSRSHELGYRPPFKAAPLPPPFRTYFCNVRMTEDLFGEHTATGKEAHGPGRGVNNLVRDGTNQLVLFIQFVFAEHQVLKRPDVSKCLILRVLYFTFLLLFALPGQNKAQDMLRVVQVAAATAEEGFFERFLWGGGKVGM